MQNIHSVRIHRFASVEIKVLEIGRDVLGIIVLYSILKGLNFRIVGAILLELFDNFLEVC